MKTIAKLIHESLEKQWQYNGLTIEQAKNTANFSALLHQTDIMAMAQPDMYSYHYIYKDDSHLIIDDEGYIYCIEDTEIRILAD